VTPPPQTFDFWYEVRLDIALPQEWTALLKRQASHHRDRLCREAGERGVISGLHSSALDGETPGRLAVTWKDLDLCVRALEETLTAHSTLTAASLSITICKWLRATKSRILTRHEQLLELDRR
jgi:hypothetical protein